MQGPKLSPQIIENLIFKALDGSNIFESEWEKEFVKIILHMFMDKGDFAHFYKYYGDKLNLAEFEWYFKQPILKLFDEDLYYDIEDEIFGEENDN